MSELQNQNLAFEKLRQQAEILIEKRPEIPPASSSDILELIHEINIQHTELKIQNEELQRAQDEISELKNEYEDLYEFAPCGYLTLNENGIITHGNLTAVTLMGTKRRFLLNSSFTQYLDSGYESLWYTAFKKAGETGEKQTVNLLLKKNKGNSPRVRAEIKADRDESNAVILWRILLLDITEQYNTQKENEKLENELRQAVKMESIGTLAGGIAHDLNNILYPIMGFTQLSQSELPKDHPVQENLTNVIDGTKRARDLVKRILLFARKKSNKLESTLLQPIIEESYKLFRATIPSNINLVLDCYDGDDHVLCDTSEIHEIILNLCTNSYHAIAEDHGEILISLRKQPPPSELNLSPCGYLCLSIKDNGVGIPEKIRDKIFEPYVTTKDVGKGSGLGLSVVYGIVQNYNGDIIVKSDPSKGTEFKIFLPITTHLDLEKKITENIVSYKKGDESILFVDDEASIMKLGVRALERYGYAVTGMQNSNEALQIFKSNPDEFDLVITDMAMPGMVGSELAKRILDIRSDIPIIICSGYSEKLDTMTEKNLNVSALLDKPLPVEKLLKKIRGILDKQKTL